MEDTEPFIISISDEALDDLRERALNELVHFRTTIDRLPHPSWSTRWLPARLHLGWTRRSSRWFS